MLATAAGTLTIGVSQAAAVRANVTQNTVGTASHRSSAAGAVSTLTITTTVAAPAGSMVVVMGAANNVGAQIPTFSAADSASSSYAVQNQGCGGPDVAGEGVCGFVATASVPSGLPIGATITITLSNTSTRIAALAQFFSGVAPSTIRQVTSSSTTTATATSASVTATGALDGDIVVGMAMVEDGSNAITADADTTNGSWSTGAFSSTNQGASLSEVYVYTQNKIVTATGSQTFNIGTISTDNYAVALVLRRMATPEPPINIVATPDNQRVDLTWDEGPTGETPITDYVIEYSANGTD